MLQEDRQNIKEFGSQAESALEVNKPEGLRLTDRTHMEEEKPPTKAVL